MKNSHSSLGVAMLVCLVGALGMLTYTAVVQMRAPYVREQEAHARWLEVQRMRQRDSTAVHDQLLGNYPEAVISPTLARS